MSSFSENLSFLRAWMGDPMRVAAVAPSSSSLARLITSELGPRTGPVIELGPGTGVFTRALIERGIPEQDLALIEFGSDFARRLSLRHPRARVLWMDAARLRRLPNLFDEGRQAGAVVSGLPLLSMSLRQQYSILAGCLAHLRPGGAIYQFTYGPRCPIRADVMERLGLTPLRVGTTARNLPPATVYRIARNAISLDLFRAGRRATAADKDREASPRPRADNDQGRPPPDWPSRGCFDQD